MRNAMIALMLALCLSLTATSMIIERGEQARIIVPIDNVDSLYFANETAGEQVMQLRFEYQESFSPLGNYLIMVELMDSYGNLVLDAPPVTFSFVYDPPGGASINGEVYTVDDSLTVDSVNGVATAHLLGHNENGLAVLRAAVESNGMIISETHSFVLHCAPVENITIQAGNATYNVGSGYWALPVSALCTSSDGENAQYGVAAWYSIADDDIEWCSIVAETYIGNHTTYSDSLQGVASSVLTYDGSYSLREVPVRVMCGNCDVTEYIQLPIGEPQVEVLPVPGHLDWTEDNVDESLVGEFLVSVTDGQGNPVDGAVLSFSSTRGEFIEPEEQYQVPDEEWWVVQTVNGISYARIEFQPYECPPVENPPNEVFVEVTVTLLETYVTDMTASFLINYNEPE